MVRRPHQKQVDKVTNQTKAKDKHKMAAREEKDNDGNEKTRMISVSLALGPFLHDLAVLAWAGSYCLSDSSL